MGALQFPAISNVTLALSQEDAFDVIKRMRVITPELFDTFLLTFLTWYQTECNDEPLLPPNLFLLFDTSIRSIYAQQFIDLFVNSYAIRFTRQNGEEPHPSFPEFTKEQLSPFANAFMRNFGEMQRHMLHDFETLLDSLQLVYVWDPIDFFEPDELYHNQFFYKHNPLVGVW